MKEFLVKHQEESTQYSWSSQWTPCEAFSWSRVILYLKKCKILRTPFSQVSLRCSVGCRVKKEWIPSPTVLIPDFRERGSGSRKQWDDVCVWGSRWDNPSVPELPLDAAAGRECFPWCLGHCSEISFKGNARVWKIIVLLHRHSWEIRTSPRRTWFHPFSSDFPPGTFGERFGQCRSLWGGQKETENSTISQNCGPIPQLKEKKEGDAEIEAFFPLLGEEQPVFGECLNSSESAPLGHQVGRREGSSEATPRPNFQTIKAQRPPWKISSLQSFLNLSMEIKAGKVFSNSNAPRVPLRGVSYQIPAAEGSRFQQNGYNSFY